MDNKDFVLWIVMLTVLLWVGFDLSFFPSLVSGFLLTEVLYWINGIRESQQQIKQDLEELKEKLGN